jgi:TPR repeat protein
LWFEKAVEAGDVLAMSLLGDKLREAGVEADRAETVQLCARAAELGEPASMGKLAACYMDGHGVPMDQKMGVAWARKAAEFGSENGMYFLADAYERGLGVAMDISLAQAWYTRAAERGQLQAKERVLRGFR